MGIKNSGASTPSAINRKLGTAYDDVRVVSENIEEVVKVSNALDGGDFVEVIDNIDEILLADDRAQAAKASADAAKASENLADQYTKGLHLSGGIWTPTFGNEYPDVVTVRRDTEYAISFGNSTGTYTFADGDLSGQTAHSTDILYYDTQSNPSRFALILSPASGAVLSVNGQVGRDITLTSENIGHEATNVSDELKKLDGVEYNALADSGLVTTGNATGGKDFAVSIKNAPTLNIVNPTDVLLMETDIGLTSITRDTLLAGVAGGVTIRGAARPLSTLAPTDPVPVTGDALNTSLVQGVAPAFGGSVTPNGFAYLVLLEASDKPTGVTVNLGGTSGSPVTITLYDQDQLMWGGDQWLHLETGDAVISVHGRFGNVVAQASDYDADQVDVTPATHVKATEVQAALEELSTTLGSVDYQNFLYGDNERGTNGWDASADDIEKSGFYYLNKDLGNLPVSEFGYILHEAYPDNTSYAKQTYSPHNDTKAWVRTKINDNWSKWSIVVIGGQTSVRTTGAMEVHKAVHRRNYTGSGFAEWGNGHYTKGAEQAIEQGLFTYSETGSPAFAKRLHLGRPLNTTALSADDISRTYYPVVNADGVELDLLRDGKDSSQYGGAIQIDFPPAPDGSKTIDTAKTVVHKYTTDAGFGEEYEAHTVDFDGSTYIDLTAVPYNMEAGAKVSMSFKWDGGNESVFGYLVDSSAHTQYIGRSATTNTLWYVGLTNVVVNGVPYAPNALILKQDVEYHLEFECTLADTIQYIGTRFALDQIWSGQIWNIKLDDPTLPKSRHYLNTTFQPRLDPTPDNNMVQDINNTDLVDGFSPSYDNDGYVTIPDFPIADKMDISVLVRPTDLSSTMGFGNFGTGKWLRFNYNQPNDRLEVTVGSKDTYLPNVVSAGNTYSFNVQLRKNSGASDYTVTVQCNEETVVNSGINFTVDSIDTFALGGDGTGNNPTTRWKGDIFNFCIDYPDSPDLDRCYYSWEDTDPTPRLTVTDNKGFTTEDWTPNFDSASTNIQLDDEWLAKVGDEISFVWTPTDGTTQFALGNSVSNEVWFGITGSEFYWGDNSRWDVYQNGVQIAYSNYTVTPNDTYFIRMVRKGADTSIGFDRIGRNRGDSTTGATGTIRDVRFTDNTNPANSRHYPLVVNSPTKPTTLEAVDNAFDKDTAPFYVPATLANRRIEIPTFVPPSGSTCKFKLIPTRETFNQTIISGNYASGKDWNAGLYVRGSDGFLRSSYGSGLIKVNGGVGGTDVAIPYDGSVVEVEFIYPNGHETTHLLHGTAGAANYLGVGTRVWDIEFTDSSDPTNSRFYPVIDYRADGDRSGTVLAETLKPEHLTEPDLNSQANWSSGQGGRGTVTFTGGTVVINNTERTTGTATQNTSQPLPLDIGDLYELEVVIDVLDGPGVRIGLGNAASSSTSGIELTTTGTHNFTLTASSVSAAAVYVYCLGDISKDTSVTVSRVSLKKINDGTLVNFPSNFEWTLAQVDDSLTAGTLENFTSGSEWANNLPITDGDMIGFSTPWEYVSSSTDATLVGTSLRDVLDIRPSQKAFLEAKITGSQVITSRKDLVFLEKWTEPLDVHDLVSPYGNVQYQHYSFEGVPLSKDLVVQTYSAFGEWDKTTTGMAANWSALTDEQKKVWADNAKNNIHYNEEDGRYYQEKYRFRVVEGLGDDWFNIKTQVNVKYLAYSDKLRVPIQGMKLAIPADYVNEDFEAISPGGSSLVTWGDLDRGTYRIRDIWADRAEFGAPFSWIGMPIAMVQRLNQGGYHPAYNPMGCRSFVASGHDWNNKWYQTGQEWTTEKLFVIASSSQVDSTYRVGSASGYVGSNYTGRSDQYESYDQIYAGQVQDLRLNANKLDTTTLLETRERKAVAGKTRGKGKVPFLTACKFAPHATNGSVGSLRYLDTNLLVRVSDFVNAHEVPSGSSTIAVDARSVGIASTNPALEVYNYNGNMYTNGVSDGNVDGDVVMVPLYTELPAEYDSLPWVDIIGDPLRLAYIFPDGVVGQWIKELPTGSAQFYTLNKKSKAAPKLEYTSDNGATWGTTTPGGYDAVRNGWSTSGDNVSTVVLAHYETLSDFTESDDNRAVVGKLGDVEVSFSNLVNYGNRLHPSLTGTIGKDSGGNKDGWCDSARGVSGRLLDDGKLNKYFHNSLVLDAPNNDSDAVKVLPHLVEKDGLLYVQYHATQLVYKGADAIRIIADGSSKTLTEGEVVFFIGLDNGAFNGAPFHVLITHTANYAAAAFDNYYIDEQGQIKNSYNDTVNAAFIKFSTRWGDDSEITIVDGGSTKADLNGNTVKVVTHTEQFPCGIANHNQDQ